jgi:thiamine biosynthesis lipoprotein
MKQTKMIMGMPVTVEIIDDQGKDAVFPEVFDYFHQVDKRFSTYKKRSEISQINAGKLKPNTYSKDMKTILQLCEDTKHETHGYFNIKHEGKLDPSGLVKGWAIYHAAQLIEKAGCKHYYVNAGGDIEVHGKNKDGTPWQVGIRNPFNRNEIVKVVSLSNGGVATSGTYIRGLHIYNPHKLDKQASELQSVTIVGPNIYDADRYATAIFAMGKRGMQLIDAIPGLEVYMIDNKGIATWSEGFEQYVLK